jgi:hypothetical protein
MIIVFSAVASIAVCIAWQLLALLLIAYILYQMHNTYYVLESDHLLVRGGLVRSYWRYEDIEEVKPLRSRFIFFAQSTTLSWDRLQVRAGLLLDSLLISPEDKEGFMRDLASRSPHLVFQGDRVIRIDKAGPGTTQQIS